MRTAPPETTRTPPVPRVGDSLTGDAVTRDGKPNLKSGGSPHFSRSNGFPDNQGTGRGCSLSPCRLDYRVARPLRTAKMTLLLRWHYRASSTQTHRHFSQVDDPRLLVTYGTGRTQRAAVRASSAGSPKELHLTNTVSSSRPSFDPSI